MGLADMAKKKTTAAVEMKICPSCESSIPTNTEVCSCGWDFPPYAPPVEPVESDWSAPEEWFAEITPEFPASPMLRVAYTSYKLAGVLASLHWNEVTDSDPEIGDFYYDTSEGIREFNRDMRILDEYLPRGEWRPGYPPAELMMFDYDRLLKPTGTALKVGAWYGNNVARIVQQVGFDLRNRISNDDGRPDLLGQADRKFYAVSPESDKSFSGLHTWAETVTKDALGELIAATKAEHSRVESEQRLDSTHSQSDLAKKPVVTVGNDCQIVINGLAFALVFEQAQYLDTLIKRGDWMSKGDYDRILGNGSDSRPDRIKNGLPPDVKSHIRTEKSKGSKWI